VDIGSDLLDIEISTALNDPEAVRDAWEDLMSEEENEEEGEMITTSGRPTGTRRMRPQGQIEEERKAWDQETKDIRNAKARERRAVKKVEAQRQLAQDQEEIERLPQQEAQQEA
jgi:hypothetical protein